MVQAGAAFRNENGVLAAAQDYLARGWAPIPIPPVNGKPTKGPRGNGWQNLTLTAEDLPQHFPPIVNIGLRLGTPSQGLVDVDLDCPEALAIAPALLPATNLVSGREHAPRSHYWYVVDPPETRTKKFQYGVKNGRGSVTLAELRGTGGQTVVFPSVHPEGDQYVWHSSGEPARVNADTLLRIVAKVAIGALLARFWPPEGARHDAALPIAGLFLAAGWDEDDAAHLVYLAARAAGHRDPADRRRVVVDTYRKAADGRPVRGIPTLKEYMPAEIVDTLWQWCRAISPNGEAALKEAQGKKSQKAEAEAQRQQAQQVHTSSEEPPLRDAIFGLIAGGGTAFEKKRVVSGLVQKHLTARGAFYRTPDGRLFFFSREERQLYDLEQRAFTHMLIEESGLSRTEAYFNFALDTLTAHVARQGKLVEVHTLAHYDGQTKVLTISDGGGGVWKREQHGEWQEGKNGDGGVLFLTEPDATSWTPDRNGGGNLQWLLDQINFYPAPLSVDDQRAFFLVWLFHQFFPSLRRTRTVPAFLGPQGSGKSTACRLTGRFLLGDAFDVAGLRKEKEDAFVAAVTNRVVYAIDNADTRVDWLEDALARYATSEVFRLRRLYTTNEEVSYRPRAILMLTSRDPHFQRPDVAQRLLPFHLQEIEEFQDEPTIFSELARRRNALWGELLSKLAEVQDTLQDVPGPKLPFRMADFARFGWQVFQAQGQADQWIHALARLDAAQMRFAAEGDGMVMALRVLMEGRTQIGPLSVSELYAQVVDIATSNSLVVPKTVEWFGRKLTAQKRVIESELNVTLLDERGHQSKRSIILKMKKDQETASPASPASPASSEPAE